MTRRLALTFCLALAALPLVAAMPAQAATLSSDGARITYTGGSESNDVLIEELGAEWTEDGNAYVDFYDFGAPITTSGECFLDGIHAYCPVASAMTITLGGGDDRLRGDISGRPAIDSQIDGGAGNDRLSGGPGNDTIAGSSGNDMLEETGECGTGNDGGADDVSGGDGVDWLHLNCRDAHVNASLDDVANDGEPGEGDNYRSDIENVKGGGFDGSGGTTFVGTDGPNVFEGHNSPDSAKGMGGNDTLTGSCGVDRLDGGAGDDRIEGQCGGDILTGGPGLDTIIGDDPCSAFSCTGGADVVEVRDGEIDTVQCGEGPDRVTADAIDQVATDLAQNCEQIDLPAKGDGDPSDPKLTPLQQQIAKKCGGLTGKKRKLCVQRIKTIARCKAKKAKTKKAKRKQAACIKKAKKIGKAKR